MCNNGHEFSVLVLLMALVTVVLSASVTPNQEKKFSVKVCSSSEPCLFGKIIMNGNMKHEYLKSATWCECAESEVCEMDAYDRRLRLDLYKCVPSATSETDETDEPTQLFLL